MFWAIVFTLSCLPLSVLTGGILSYVDITMLQKEGRQENEDILFINETLSELTGIKVHHARKALDNQHVVLVLGIEEICHWSRLTSALSSRGYQISVRPLQGCSDYANELGVSISYHDSSEMETYDILEYFEVIYYDKGMETNAYLERLTEHFKRDVSLQKAGIKTTCYQRYGQLPVELMYFAFVNPTEVTGVDRKVRHESKAFQEITLLQSFRSYMKTC